MPTLIIHLTDIHLDSMKDPVLSRAGPIVAAALSDFGCPPTECHVILSGDIAQSGKQNQYELAIALLGTISSEIHQRIGKPPLIFAVPGNHDCDMPEDPSVRQDVIESIKKNGATAARERQLKLFQSNFWEFVAKVSPAQSQSSAWESRLVAPSGKITYVGLNSALLSTLDEDQGKLFVPFERLMQDESEGIVAYVMHHPLNWLEANASNGLLEFVRDRADLLFFGHEHRGDLVKVKSIYGGADYDQYCGDVLQERGNMFKSAFRTVAISDDGKEGKATRYRWVGDKYERDEGRSDDVWRSFGRDMSRATRLGFSKSHQDWIDDAGAGFTHRKKERISLSDTFVWPALRRNVPDAGQTLLLDSTQVFAEQILDEVIEARKVYILGDEQCGKTTLAKRWCRLFREAGFFPLYISAKNSSKANAYLGADLYDAAIAQQYGASCREDYTQLDAKRRILLLDDFEVLGGNAEKKREVFEHITKIFGKTFVFVNSAPGLEVTLDTLGIVDTKDSQLYDFLPLSFELRAQIIDRWLAIGDDGETESVQRDTTAARLTRLVDDTLGRNLIPSVPIFVLIILQQAEAERDLDAVIKNGSHGFLYQALITQTLNRRVSVFSVDTATTYLTMFAGQLFTRNVEGLSEREFKKFHDAHGQEYDLTYSAEKVQAQLMAAEILSHKRELISFRYPYLHYFFVANYLNRSPSSEREHAVSALLETIYTERSANILLFLAHLSLDEGLIKKLAKSAKECFAAYPEYNLFATGNLLDQLDANKVRQIYVSFATRHENLAEYERTQKRDVAIVESNGDAILGDENLLLSINRAVKTLQVLGQVLRNHSGSLKAGLKKEIMEDCVGLGLRTLSGVFDLIGRNAPAIMERRFAKAAGLKAYVRDANREQDEARRFLGGQVLDIAVGMFVKTASAIGSEELAPTIERVLRPAAGGSRSLLDIAVKLEHFSKFPEEALIEFRDKKLSVNEVMPAGVIRRFIVRRFYLFPDRVELKAKICDLFKIARKVFQARQVQAQVQKHR